MSATETIRQELTKISDYSPEDIDLIIEEMKQGVGFGYGPNWALLMPNNPQIVAKWKNNIDLYLQTNQLFQVLPLKDFVLETLEKEKGQVI